MNHRALDHALEAGGRLGVVGAVGDQIFEFGLEIVDEAGAQLVEIDAAGTHHRRRIRSHRSATAEDVRASRIDDDARLQSPAHDAGLFKALGKSWHSRPLWPPVIMIAITRSGNNNLRHPLSYSYATIVAKDRFRKRGFPLNSRHPRLQHATLPAKLPGIRSASVSTNRCKTRSCSPAGSRAHARLFLFPSRIAGDAGACAQNPSPA